MKESGVKLSNKWFKDSQPELIALERMIELFEEMLQHQFIKPSGEIPVVNLMFNINNYQQGVAVGMLFAYKKAVVEMNWDCSDNAMINECQHLWHCIPDVENSALFNDDGRFPLTTRLLTCYCKHDHPSTKIFSDKPINPLIRSSI